MPVRQNFLAVGIAAVTAASVGAFALPTGSQAFSPVSYALALPATVSAASPVRIVTTSIDAFGRPSFRVQVATDKAQATRIAEAARKAGGAVEVDTKVYALDGPSDDDPYRADQWDLEKINAPGAWETSTGRDVVVAVIDSGVDGSHPDLDGQVLTGYDAIEDVDGGDSDGNGHGTHVAGTIAALAGNGEGVAGFAPDSKVLPVKVLGADGSGFTSDTAEGIVWAVDNGAQIINMSIGSTDPSEAEEAAVTYALQQGVTVVAAAGNEREEGSPTSYPAAYEGVIAVAATDSEDEVAEYSNAGDYVDVAAPGSGILSTWPGGGYEELNGTSMASPHVAAVAALLKAYQPDLGPSDIEELLESTAVDLGESGFDSDYGNGRIDAAAAIDAADDGDGGGDEKVVPVITSPAGKRVAYGTKVSTRFHVSAGSDDEALTGVAGVACVAVGEKDGCDDVETDENGDVTVKHTATGAFRVTLTVSGSDTVEEATAGTAYTVQAVVKATRTGKGAITVKVGGANGQKLTLQRQVKGKWSNVKTYSAKSSLKITGLVAGGSYRFVLANTKLIEGVTSGTVKA